MKPRKFLGNSIDLKTGGGYLTEQALIFSCRARLAVVERIDCERREEAHAASVAGRTSW